MTTNGIHLNLPLELSNPPGPPHLAVQVVGILVRCLFYTIKTFILHRTHIILVLKDQFLRVSGYCVAKLSYRQICLMNTPWEHSTKTIAVFRFDKTYRNIGSDRAYSGPAYALGTNGSNYGIAITADDESS